MFPLSHQHGLTNNSNTGQKTDVAVVFQAARVTWSWLSDHRSEVAHIHHALGQDLSWHLRAALGKRPWPEGRAGES